MPLPYLVLLQAGFTVPRAVTSRAVRSYRTFSPLPTEAGGLFSVALSVGSRPPGVTWRPVRRSPDFPLQLGCSDCLADSGFLGAGILHQSGRSAAISRAIFCRSANTRLVMKTIRASARERAHRARSFSFRSAPRRYARRPWRGDAGRATRAVGRRRPQCHTVPPHPRRR